MPEDVTPTAVPAGDAAPADAPAADAPAANPNEGVTPAAARPVVEPGSSAPKDQRPSVMDIWAAEKEAGTLEGTGDDDEPETPAPAADAPATPEASAEDLAKLEGKTPEDLTKLAAASKEDLDAITASEKVKADAAPDDASKAKADLDTLLETFDDPAVLNAALERAGVDKLAELPAVKALVGRLVQGARDQTKAEVVKAQQQAAQLAEVTAEGKAAKGKLVAALNKLATDIEDGVEEGLAIPTEEAIGTAFEEYAGAAVGEYHTKAWNVLSDAVYSLPEMGGPVPEGVSAPPPFTPEQNQLLEAVKGSSPDVWLAAHLAVERDVLWAWAQQEAAAKGQGSFENDKVLLQAAHTKEIRDLTKTHTAALATARDEARAEALADAGSGKLPPKTPARKQPVTTGSTEEENESVFKGKTPGEIRKIVAQRQGAGVEV